MATPQPRPRRHRGQQVCWIARARTFLLVQNFNLLVACSFLAIISFFPHATACSEAVSLYAEPSHTLARENVTT